jgi:hypothetical protein
MPWFLILIVTFISAFLIYSKRYTSDRKFFGIYFVQFYYLVIAAPIVGLCLINIGLDIVKNPEVININIPTDSLLSLYFLSILVGVIGTAVHSVSTSQVEALKRHIFLRAYSYNEEIHGPVSHEMLYLATVAVILLNGLLAVNHPNLVPFEPVIPFYTGAMLGLFLGLSVILSTHVGLALIATFFSALILLNVVTIFSLRLDNHPNLVFDLTVLIFMFCTILLSVLLYFKSKKATKIMIKIIFPKGHPIHETFSVF